MTPSLHVIMYHYVRDLPNTPFPKIKGMLTRDFRHQLSFVQDRYEMATLDSALDFLRGTYVPARDLCLLTFDDGLKEHYSEITPLLTERKIRGLFFLITSCLNGRYIAPVHMNHFLMAGLDFEEYRESFLRRVTELTPNSKTSIDVDPGLARRTYRWDIPEVASFKYLFNFLLDCDLRDRILEDLFVEKIGDIPSFANTLYLNSDEAREMQNAGMIVGGHSHWHKPLSSLSPEELGSDLATCLEVLAANLNPQTSWPFCYPYGKKDSFSSASSEQLKRFGFVCSFSTEVGSNVPGVDLFGLRRIDCKDVPTQ